MAIGRSVLRYLIALGQIRIEVILSREDGQEIDLAVQGMRGPDRQLHGPAVQHRQRAWQPEADGADIGVRRRPEPRAAPAEDLGFGEQLRVDFEPNHGLE